MSKLLAVRCPYIFNCLDSPEHMKSEKQQDHNFLVVLMILNHQSSILFFTMLFFSLLLYAT